MVKKANTPTSFRFEPLTDFALDLVARQRTQKRAAVIHDAVIALGKQVADDELGQSLATLYHVHEGVRTLNLLACPSYKTTPDEDDLRAFLVAHKEFFYADDKATVPSVALVTTLWDQLEHYRQLWREKRHDNYWVAAEAMEARLKKAKIKPPKYGQGK